MNRVVHAAAEADILRHVARYAAQGLPNIARRFLTSVVTAIDAIEATPDAGSSIPSANLTLTGLRSRPVKGFDGFWIYYLDSPERVAITRVLHAKRDIGIVPDSEPPGS